MTTATVETITTAQAEGFYANVMDKIRDRQRQFKTQDGKWKVIEGERPDVAVAHVVMGMSLFDVEVVFEWLKAQPALAEVDRLLAEALAKRLGLVIEFKRTQLELA